MLEHEIRHGAQGVVLALAGDGDTAACTELDAHAERLIIDTSRLNDLRPTGMRTFIRLDAYFKIDQAADSPPAPGA